MKITKIIFELFPIIKPEWLFCTEKEVPVDIKAAFYEEEEYQRRIGKISMDIKIKGYRYILTPKKEIFMRRRKVSLI